MALRRCSASARRAWRTSWPVRPRAAKRPVLVGWHGHGYLPGGTVASWEVALSGSLTAGRGDAGLACLVHPVVPVLRTGPAGVVMASPAISDHCTGPASAHLSRAA